jgi:hypothetical protein
MNDSPGALVFHRDMMLNIPLIVDLITIRNSFDVRYTRPYDILTVHNNDSPKTRGQQGFLLCYLRIGNLKSGSSDTALVGPADLKRIGLYSSKQFMDEQSESNLQAYFFRHVPYKPS